MGNIYEIIGIYVLILGAGLTFLGVLEMLMPSRAFSLWKRWSGSTLFFLHGILLVIGGFPLTVYEGYFSGFVFMVGLFSVLAGPFIIIYPEKFAGTFEAASREMNKEMEIILIRIEAVIRIVTGIVFIITFFM